MASIITGKLSGLSSLARNSVCPGNLNPFSYKIDLAMGLVTIAENWPCLTCFTACLMDSIIVGAFLGSGCPTQGITCQSISQTLHFSADKLTLESKDVKEIFRPAARATEDKCSMSPISTIFFCPSDHALRAISGPIPDGSPGVIRAGLIPFMWFYLYR